MDYIVGACLGFLFAIFIYYIWWYISTSREQKQEIEHKLLRQEYSAFCDAFWDRGMFYIRDLRDSILKVEERLEELQPERPVEREKE